jgi:hypothetical protein
MVAVSDVTTSTPPVSNIIGNGPCPLIITFMMTWPFAMKIGTTPCAVDAFECPKILDAAAGTS